MFPNTFYQNKTFRFKVIEVFLQNDRRRINQMPKSLIKNEELTYLWRTKNTTQVSDVDLEKKHECRNETWLQISFFCFSLCLTIFEKILSSYDRFFMMTLALTVVFWPWRRRNCSKCEGYLPYPYISFTKQNVNVDVRQRVFGEHHRQNHLGNVLLIWSIFPLHSRGLATKLFLCGPFRWFSDAKPKGWGQGNVLLLFAFSLNVVFSLLLFLDNPVMITLNYHQCLLTVVSRHSRCYLNLQRLVTSAFNKCYSYLKCTDRCSKNAPFAAKAKHFFGSRKLVLSPAKEALQWQLRHISSFLWQTKRVVPQMSCTDEQSFLSESGQSARNFLSSKWRFTGTIYFGIFWVFNVLF